MRCVDESKAEMLAKKFNKAPRLERKDQGRSSATMETEYAGKVTIVCAHD